MFLHNWLTAKGVKPYFQPNLFSHILKIASTAQKNGVFSPWISLVNVKISSHVPKKPLTENFFFCAVNSLTQREQNLKLSSRATTIYDQYDCRSSYSKVLLRQIFESFKKFLGTCWTLDHFSSEIIGL